MTDQDEEERLRARVELTGLSYADWEMEANSLKRAADAAALGGYVDGQHLVRAGELADAIDAEILMLDEVGVNATGELAGQLSGVRNRLAALRDSIRGAARKMHGLT